MPNAGPKPNSGSCGATSETREVSGVRTPEREETDPEAVPSGSRSSNPGVEPRAPSILAGHEETNGRRAPPAVFRPPESIGRGERKILEKRLKNLFSFFDGSSGSMLQCSVHCLFELVEIIGAIVDPCVLWD